MTTALVIAVLVYVGIVAALAIFQRRLLYFPYGQVMPPAAYGLADVVAATLQADDGTPLEIWYSAAPPARPTILYFHGNGGYLGSRAQKFATIVGADYGLLAMSYRGFGLSGGRPSERAILADAQALHRHARDELGVATQTMVVWGESLGTGVAVDLASRAAVGAVLLEAPYRSVRERAGEIYVFAPVGWLLRDRFETMQKLPQVDVPILVMHGTRDGIIPIRHGRDVYAAANEPKHAVWFEGVSHDEIDPATIVAELEAFLARTGVIADARVLPPRTRTEASEGTGR